MPNQNQAGQQINIEHDYFKKTTIGNWHEPKHDDDIMRKLNDIIERIEKLEQKERPSLIIMPTDEEMREISGISLIDRLKI
jgi:CheY-like chemotaxis protein